MTSGPARVTPHILQCGEPLLPISLASLPLVTVGKIPDKADCDSFLGDLDSVVDPRMIVLGTDASLAAVLTRLMRTDRLHIEVAYVAENPTEASQLFRIGTGSRAAAVAVKGTATPVPLIRDDTGSAVVGRAVVTGGHGALDGEAYCDDTRLFSGTVPAVEVEPTLELPGLRARVQGKGCIFRHRWVSGRAVQFGGPSVTLTRDGVPTGRETTRSTMYRHDKQWLLVR